MSLKQQADQLLSAAVTDGAVPGVVALATNAEGTYYEGGFGERIQGDGVEMTPDTVVWLASMTKAITGAAAMIAAISVMYAPVERRGRRRSGPAGRA